MSIHEYLVLGVLRVLLQRAETPTNLAVLSDQLGASAERIEVAVDHLASRGLVRAEPLRLTFSGLAAASALTRLEQRPRRAQHAA